METEYVITMLEGSKVSLVEMDNYTKAACIAELRSIRGEFVSQGFNMKLTHPDTLEVSKGNLKFIFTLRKREEVTVTPRNIFDLIKEDNQY